MSVVQAATNLHSLYPVPVNVAQYCGIVGTFNNHNMAPKIIYSLLTCRFFRKLIRNIFLVIILLCSVMLILSLSSTLINSFHTKIKTINWSVLITFLILIVIMSIVIHVWRWEFFLLGYDLVTADHTSNVKKVVFSSILKTLFLQRFLIFSCCRNVLTLN